MGAAPQARPTRATDGPSVTTPGRQRRGAVVGAEARARRHQNQVPEYASTTSLELTSSLPRRVGRSCNTFDHWRSGATGYLPRAHSGQGLPRRQILQYRDGPSPLYEGAPYINQRSWDAKKPAP